MKSTKGFTLLEILIVLVILAVVAGLAIPAYQASVEKSRAQEAVRSLQAVRESMMRHHAATNTFVGAVLGEGHVDYDPNDAAAGQTPIFSYALSNLGAATFTCTATRLGGPVGTIAINQAGAITRTGVYNT